MKMLRLNCTKRFGEWSLRNIFPDISLDSVSWDLEKQNGIDSCERFEDATLHVYDRVIRLITQNSGWRCIPCTCLMKSGHLKKGVKPKWCDYSSVAAWATLIAGLAFYSTVGWDFHSPLCPSSGTVPLLALLRSFSALISHLYCLIFCRYTELRPFRKVSNKCQCLSKGNHSNACSWGTKRRTTASSYRLAASLICWRALFHQKLLKDILLQRQYYSWRLFSFQKFSF